MYTLLSTVSLLYRPLYYRKYRDFYQMTEYSILNNYITYIVSLFEYTGTFIITGDYFYLYDISGVSPHTHDQQSTTTTSCTGTYCTLYSTIIYCVSPNNLLQYNTSTVHMIHHNQYKHN